MNYLISVDAGTTSFKGAVFNEKGELKGIHNSSYELITGEGSVVEFTAEGYKKAFHDVITGLFEKTGIHSKDVVGLSIDSQGETLICLNKEGEALRNPIVWLDNRAVSEAEELEKNFDVQKVYEVTGQPEVAATWPASKLLWIKKKEPEVFKKIDAVFLLEDYLIHMLTGKRAAEKSLLTSTMYLDINTGKWWKDVLDYIGIEESQLPEIHHSGVAVGRVTKEAAGEFQLSEGTMVVTGALDQLAGMIGAGITGSDQICETTGTCLTVCIPVTEIPTYKKTGTVPCHAGALNGEYYQIYWSQTAGAVLEWFKTNFYNTAPDGKSADDVYQLINEEASSVPPGSQGLIMLPHLSGMACPEFNPHAKGVFYGIQLMHGRKHFSRAIMESVGYMVKEFLVSAEKSGGSFDEIHSLGGGAKSELWNQMKADITGKKIVTLKNDEAACLGTAILAGVGTGVFANIDSAVKKLVSTDKEYSPEAKNRDQYEKGYNAYMNIYSDLKGTFKKY